MTQISKDELKELYWNEEMTQKEIADKIGVSQAMVHKYMENYGIKARDRSWTNKEEELLEKVYPHLTPEEAAYLFERSEQAITSKAKSMRVKSKEFSRLEGLDENLLNRLYNKKGLSQEEIAKIFGVTKRAIRLRMRKYGIKPRHYTNKKGRPLPDDREFFCWLAGFVDGDGNLTVTISRHRNRLGYREFEPVPMITVTQKGTGILRKIKTEIGYGYVNDRSEKRGAEYVLRSPFKKVKELAESLLPFLKVKKEDCEIFLEICRMKDNGKHLSKEGMMNIAELRDKTNKRKPKPNNYKTAEWFKRYWNYE